MSEQNMNIELKQVNGITFAAKGDSNHWVIMDGPETFNGSSAGSRPMELILMGLGGCTGMDVVSILQKKKVKLDDYKMKISAERAEKHPKVYTKIKIEFIFIGRDIKEKDVERAISLSENTYCSASAMLKKTAEIETSYKIINS